MEAVRELGLVQGSNVTAVIKVSDVLVVGAAGIGLGPVGGVTVSGPQSPGSRRRSPDPDVPPDVITCRLAEGLQGEVQRVGGATVATMTISR